MRIIDVVFSHSEMFDMAFSSWQTEDKTSKWKMMTVFLLF